MLTTYLQHIENFIWGPPLLILLVVIGIYLTFSLRFIQLRYLGYSLRLAFLKNHNKGEGDITHFQALMTSLAATIGIGSIAGVATAIAAGGLGALFWIWVAAFLGMATKYAESILAVKYRQLSPAKEMSGGPMYYLDTAMGAKKGAIFFAVVAAITAFGTGNMVQANAVASALFNSFHIPPLFSGIILTIVTAAALFGGIKSIGKVASYLVPVMALLYVGGGLSVLAMRYQLIIPAIIDIVTSAFVPQAAKGGFLGASVMMAVQYGISRGLFSSEAGLGSAPIAAAAAKSDVPARQALISMSGVFITSFIVCTITGLAIAVSGVLYEVGEGGDLLNGSVMVIAAFNKILPGSGIIITISLILFAYSTILGWAYYGEKCIEYLLGKSFITYYRIAFIAALIPGALLSLTAVWSFANIMNGLMAFPNLIALIALAPIVAQETATFDAQIEREKLGETWNF